MLWASASLWASSGGYRRAVTRLVLDTNAMRGGQFDTAQLSQWVAALGEGGVDVFIPEVVVWEWAEHAAAAHASLAAAIRGFNVDPVLFATPSVPDEVSREELVVRIRQAVRWPVRVWSPPVELWREALVDQVLLVGVGERKEGVKTGAADAVVLACVSEQVEERRGAEPVLLATNDRRLRRACIDQFDDDVLFVSGTRDLLRKLIEFRPAEQELFEAVDESLRELISYGRESELNDALQTFTMGYQVTTSALRPAVFHELARLQRVTDVELHELRIGEDQKERIGLADVRLWADLHMTLLELTPGEVGSSEWTTSFDGIVKNGRIDLQVTLTFDQHWDLESAVPSGAAQISFGADDDEDHDEDEWL